MKLWKKILKSLQLRIVVLLLIFASIPCIIVENTILKSYETRAVNVRTAEIQAQSVILGNQMNSNNYFENTTSEVIDAKLTQLSNIYNGRVMIIDSDYKILKDTYGVDLGKNIVSPDVIQCFKEGIGTSKYDTKNRYIEITTPIMRGEGEIQGVILVGISIDTIEDSMEILRAKARTTEMTLFVIVFVLSCSFAVLMGRPFKRLAKSISDVTEGYDSEAIREDAYSETIEVAEALGKVLGRVKILDESRQEFVSSVSHELKTPITSMKVLADSLLIQENAPVELYREFMEDIVAEIEREDKIINDLLALVKLDKTSNDLNIQQENINELLERILKRLRPIAALKNIEMVMESFRTVTAEVDEVKLTLAISNLVENAIKYNKPDGWVYVSLDADHKYFYIEVADSGIGIPEEEKDHIFEKFYRVDKSHSREIGGTGLGLAITKNAVIMHRGSVKVESKEVGTKFKVRIPLAYTK